MTNEPNPTDETPTDAPVAEAAAETPEATEAPEAAAVEASASDRPARRARKTREGVVVSNSMQKTAVVAVIERVRHPKYNKFVLQTKKLYAHDEDNDANVGDRVRVMETRPRSKQKRWRVTEVLERAR